VEAVSDGVVDIFASNGGPQPDGFSRLTVIGPGYDIELRYLTSVSGYETAFENAVSRWEGLITGNVSNRLQQSAAVSCAPAINEVVDDLLIFVTIESIDGVGGTLGQAGPCWIRPGGDPDEPLPITGQMRFDSDDLPGLSPSELEDVITHEMAHVLGFGTMWSYQGLQLGECNDTGDPYFDGENAKNAFDNAGGTSYMGNKVPVEDTGGEGTICVHWRESVHDNELMTGWIDATNPLSAITVESLGDQGYTVNAAGADPYTLPSGPMVRREGGKRLLNDVLPGPMYTTGPDGTVVTIPQRSRRPR
jgi:hypothetical protein